MDRHGKGIAALALAAALAGGSWCPAQTAGKVTEVRVYRGQALVTRQVDFDARAGAQELAVTGLPERVVPDSLYAEGAEGVTIRAVRFRATAVEEEPRPEVRALEAKIEELQEETRKIASQLAVLKSRGQYLDKLEGFVAPTAQVELTKGVLDPEALTQLTELIFQKRDEIASETLKMEGRKAEIAEELKVLARKRAALAAEEAKTLREAVVLLESPRAGRARLALSYLVEGVGWSPAYTARLGGPRNRLVLEYNAVVTQMCGEDWPDVRLTLSTSHPTMLAEAPVLSPLWIGLVSAQGKGVQKAKDARDFTRRQALLNAQIRSQAQPRAQGARRAGQEQQIARGPDRESVLGANVLAAQLQQLELAAPDDVVRTSKRMRTSQEEGLAVDYPMEGRVSLQSRKDHQMFRIATVELDAGFYYAAVPLLSEYVYQAVEAVNTSDVPLLSGPYSAYLDGAFAGRGRLPLVARGQSLTLGFGTETRLRASRTLDEKKTGIRGGNKLLTYTYRVRLENFMGRAVKVRVWDRLPQAPDRQVAATLLPGHPPLSEEPLYLALERPQGLLRWDVEVPAGASGAKAHSFAYSFQLEFDKSFTIGEAPAQALEKMRTELEAIMRARGR